MNNREVIKLSTSTLKTVHLQPLSSTLSGMEELIGPIFVLTFFKYRIPVGMLDLYSQKMYLILTLLEIIHLTSINSRFCA